MRRLLLIGLGAGVGYVLGARAGRPAYDRISGTWQKVMQSTGLAQTAQTMTSAAQDLGDAGLHTAKQSMSGVADEAADAMGTAAGRLREQAVDVSDSAVWTPSSAME